MFVGGFCTFSMLYSMQPLMPMFAQDFALSPAAASSVLSVPTTGLALALIPASFLADKVGRKPVMNIALSLAALLMLLAAFAQLSAVSLSARHFRRGAGWPACGGHGLPERRVEPLSLGHSIGLYIAGNALGGMSGRFLAAVIADHFGWRAAVLALAVLGIAGAIEFWRSLPDSRHFKPVPLNLAELRRDVGSHFADGGLPWLFLSAFLFMGFCQPVQLPGFPLAGRALQPQSQRAGLCVLAVHGGHLGLGLGGAHGRPLWPPHVVADGGADGCRAGVHAGGFAVADGAGHRAVYLRLLWWPFGGQQLDRPPCATRQGAGLGVLPDGLLSGFQRGGSFSGLLWGMGKWNGVAAMIALGLLALLLIALRLRKLEPLAV
jgi:YNFM family putative membrane transporter